MDVLAGLLDVLSDAVHLWASALALRPDPFGRQPDTDPQPASTAAFVLVALAATVGNAVGRSVVLYLNRLRGWGLVWSLAADLAVGLLASAVYALLLWLAARAVAGDPPDWRLLLRLVLLSSAPLTLAFLTVMPLLGPLWERFLQLWGLAVLWVGVSRLWPVEPWRVGVAMVLAAVVLMGAQALLASRLAALRDAGYRRLTGRPLHPDSQYLLEVLDAPLASPTGSHRALAPGEATPDPGAGAPAARPPAERP